MSESSSLKDESKGKWAKLIAFSNGGILNIIAFFSIFGFKDNNNNNKIYVRKNKTKYLLKCQIYSSIPVKESGEYNAV